MAVCAEGGILVQRLRIFIAGPFLFCDCQVMMWEDFCHAADIGVEEIEDPVEEVFAKVA